MGPRAALTAAGHVLYAVHCRYEGQYQEDLPHGYGNYYFASGQCYQGQWQLGKKHGWSVYTVDNGGAACVRACVCASLSAVCTGA